jgi:hypothetical protein
MPDAAALRQHAAAAGGQDAESRTMHPTRKRLAENLNPGRPAGIQVLCQPAGIFKIPLSGVFKLPPAGISAVTSHGNPGSPRCGLSGPAGGGGEREREREREREDQCPAKKRRGGGTGGGDSYLRELAGWGG